MYMSLYVDVVHIYIYISIYTYLPPYDYAWHLCMGVS